MQPFFSVIIPLYNKEAYIKSTLETVVSQTFKNFEVIIVNDGSTDDSLIEAEKIKDSRIKIISQENKGASVARNRCIELSRADYIAFLDADDLWLDNHLETLHSLILDYPDAGMFSTGYLISYRSKTKKAVIKNIEKNFRGIISNFFECNLYDSIVNSSISVVKKTAIENVNCYDIDIKSGQDIDLWIRVALRYKVAFYNITTGIYAKNDESLSNSTYVKDKIKYLNKYKAEEKKDKSLKKFMDTNRYSVAIYYKMIKELTIASEVYNEIEKSNLSLKQKIIYNLPSIVIRNLASIKKKLDGYGLFLYLYR